MRNIEDQPPADLGQLEHRIMLHVWNHGPCTADDCRRSLAPRKLKDATVRTVLRRLEEKGFVRHRVEGRTFWYQAVEPPRRVAARAVQGIVQRFCGGSLEQLLVGMVDNEDLDSKELERLAKKISAAKGQKEREK